MTRTNALRVFVPLVALAAVVGGCGGGAGDNAGAPAKESGTGIEIKNFVYSPVPAEVTLGQSVTVTNQNAAVHTLTVPDGIDSCDLGLSESFTFTPSAPGTLDYLCDIHQYMKGRIVAR